MDMVPGGENAKLLWDVAAAVVDYWSENYAPVTMESVFSRSHRRADREARIAVMYAAKELLGFSYAEIGRFLSRDRSTVSRAVYSVTSCLNFDERDTLLTSVTLHMLDSQVSGMELSESAGS